MPSAPSIPKQPHNCWHPDLAHLDWQDLAEDEAFRVSVVLPPEDDSYGVVVLAWGLVLPFEAEPIEPHAIPEPKRQRDLGELAPVPIVPIKTFREATGTFSSTLVLVVGLMIAASIFRKDRALHDLESIASLLCAMAATAAHLWLRNRQFVKKAVRFVGREGVALGERYIAFADVVDAKGIRLLLNTGSTLHIHGAEQEARKVRHAYFRYRQTTRRAPVRLGFLSDSKANTKAWLESLDGVAARRGGTYRSEPVDVHQLRRIVANPHQSPLERAGAALVLQRIDPGAKVRIAKAAERVALPPLRHVLEVCASASKEDFALEEAQEELEALWQAQQQATTSSNKPSDH